MRQVGKVHKAPIEDDASRQRSRVNAILLTLVAFPEMAEIEDRQSFGFCYFLLHSPYLGYSHIYEPVYEATNVASVTTLNCEQAGAYPRFS